MKILLVTPVNPQLPDKRPLPTWQAQNFWRLSLVKLGHQVKVFRLNDRPRVKPVKSWQLKRLIHRWQPEEVFFSAGVDAVYPVESTVFFSGVAPETLSADERKTGQLAKLVVTNDQTHVNLWQKLGAKAVCLPISAVDPEFFRPAQVAKIYPLVFIGTLTDDRQEFLAKISRSLPQLKVWGWLPPKTKLMPQLVSSYQGEAWGKAMVKIYQKSLIGLNLAPEHMMMGGNLRSFETAAAGALLLTDQLNPHWYEPQKEAVKFNSAADCVRKINFYLNHPDRLKSISQGGYKKTLSCHTYLQRLKCLLILL